MSTVPHESVNWTPYQPPQPNSLEPAGTVDEAPSNFAETSEELPAVEAFVPRSSEEIAAIRAKQTIKRSGSHLAIGTMLEQQPGYADAGQSSRSPKSPDQIRNREGFSDLHEHRYDSYVSQAKYFVSQLGMNYIDQPTISVMNTDKLPALQNITGNKNLPSGQFNPDYDELFVVAKPEVDQHTAAGREARLIVVTSLVHELTHSATFIAPTEIGSENYRTEAATRFYNEVFAGLAESEFLAATRTGNSDAVDTYPIDKELFGIHLKHELQGEYRYFNTGMGREINSSQALIAASVIKPLLLEKGISTRDLLSLSKDGSNGHMLKLQRVLEDVRPGLAKDIDTATLGADSGDKNKSGQVLVCVKLVQEALG